MDVTVGLISLGCAKNRVDSEQMLGLLTQWGYRITDHAEEAEVLIVNTCGFIESAKQESIDTLLEMASYKKTGRCRLLIATGCLVQRYAEALHGEMHEIDAFIGVNDYPSLRALLRQASAGERPVACNRSGDVFEGKRILTTPSYSAFVRISDGCDNCCAYCAIPLIRGGYRSRQFSHITEEMRELAGRGVRELTFIAQDTTRYGEDLLPKKRLDDLLRYACGLDEVAWVRVLYCYPDRVSDALLDLIANEPKACAYLDLPLQHIDENILRAMNRRGSPQAIRSLVRKARERNIVLRTTMIVGFPGETKDAFERLLDFVEESAFERLGAFAYSAEDDTTASSMPHQVPEELKQERLDRLMRLQRRISAEYNEKRIGEVCTALITGQEKGAYLARSEKEAPEGDGILLLHSPLSYEPGSFVKARIIGAKTYDVSGEILP